MGSSALILAKYGISKTMPDVVLLAVGGVFAYLALLVAHEVISVVLNLLLDAVRFLMKVFCVKRS